MAKHQLHIVLDELVWRRIGLLKSVWPGKITFKQIVVKSIEIFLDEYLGVSEKSALEGEAESIREKISIMKGLEK